MQINGTQTEKHKTIYLDHNATTPCAPEVLEAMLHYFTKEFGNPSSPHRMGRSAALAIGQARERLAALVSCEPEEIVFTSGATESNNIALLGAAMAARDRKKIVISAVEHKSVIGPCEFLETRGFDVVKLPVDQKGLVDIEVAERVIDDKTLLVSIQGASNETGTIQSVFQIASIGRSHGALIHSDCAQLLGKVPLSVFDLCLDFASFSAHKMYGPKGIGALFISRKISRSQLSPIHFGGGQEQAIRPGTLNTPAIIGFGEACHLAQSCQEDEAQRIANLRDSFEREILASLDGITINGAIGSRLPGTTSLTISGVPADVLIANVPSLCISEGSACTSGSLGPSHVLLAMGRSPEEAEMTVRVAFGMNNDFQDSLTAIDLLSNRVKALRDRVEP